ncbi:unnamed protein product [Vitrella brassicaformis CCMP3155]|uniref:Protein kinase domain-containing protein n=2 Tax=Vitrella brassicaformis TaxID=1169539 RepID=A0A0G4F7Q0_VITBC|nr:unnamed protein product [Vitrella brassicaformis CCMP3155]|eukprot:CEM08525.1 unnamed protein product [Vitrella brassicaformis CCMP3155]
MAPHTHFQPPQPSWSSTPYPLLDTLRCSGRYVHKNDEFIYIEGTIDTSKGPADVLLKTLTPASLQEDPHNCCTKEVLTQELEDEGELLFRFTTENNGCPIGPVLYERGRLLLTRREKRKATAEADSGAAGDRRDSGLPFALRLLKGGGLNSDGEEANGLDDIELGGPFLLLEHIRSPEGQTGATLHGLTAARAAGGPSALSPARYRQVIRDTLAATKAFHATHDGVKSPSSSGCNIHPTHKFLPPSATCSSPPYIREKDSSVAGFRLLIHNDMNDNNFVYDSLLRPRIIDYQSVQVLVGGGNFRSAPRTIPPIQCLPPEAFREIAESDWGMMGSPDDQSRDTYAAAVGVLFLALAGLSALREDMSALQAGQEKEGNELADIFVTIPEQWGDKATGKYSRERFLQTCDREARERHQRLLDLLDRIEGVGGLTDEERVDMAVARALWDKMCVPNKRRRASIDEVIAYMDGIVGGDGEEENLEQT